MLYLYAYFEVSNDQIGGRVSDRQFESLMTEK